MTEPEDELNRLSAREQDERVKTSRAANVQASLNDENWLNAFETVRTGLVTTMTESADDQVALDARHVLRAMGMLEGALRKHIADGKIAQDEIDEIVQRREHLTRHQRTA